MIAGNDGVGFAHDSAFDEFVIVRIRSYHFQRSTDFHALSEAPDITAPVRASSKHWYARPRHNKPEIMMLVSKTTRSGTTGPRVAGHR